MRLKCLGTGDAFGSGGRFNTCFLVERGGGNFLIDCGASAMIAIRKFDVDPTAIGTIVLSHLHADHFGGLPSFILDAQLVSRRTRPLVIVGPVGLASRLEALMEAHFPGSSKVERKFAVELIELQVETATPVGPELAVTAFSVVHPSGTPSLALRLACDDKVIAYTGDTEWVDALVTAGHGADLLIAECYTRERKVRFHLDYMTLKDRLPALGARRIVLTHLSSEMLAAADDLAFEVAFDGLEIDFG